MRERKPPFSPDTSLREYCDLLKAYGVSTTVYGDRYAGEWPRERFRVMASATSPAKPKCDIYRDLLPVLNSGRVELLDHPRLISQLCQLERHAGGAKDSVKHPPGGHDDVANAVAGAIVMALQVAAVRAPNVHVMPDLSATACGIVMPGSMGDSWSPPSTW